MTVEFINLKPQTTEVTLGDYGNFFIRKFGAGEELELARIARELTELEGLELDEEEKDPEKMKEQLETIKKSMEKLQELQNIQLDIIRAVVSCDDEKRKERLFRENSSIELFKVIGKVARG